MRIALVSPTRLTTPPAKYGGVELVVSTLAEELHALGHDVTLLATGDSKTSAKLYPIQAHATRAKSHFVSPELELSQDFRSTAKAADFLSENHFDIIHNHSDWLLLPFHKRLQGRLVTTCHRNYQQADVMARMVREFQDLSFISISDNQRNRLPELNYVKTIYNGIDTKKYDFNETPDDYLLFLGRISPLKDPVTAIKIAHKTNQRLLIAAKIDLKDQEYYRTEVAPLIDGEHVVYVGEVGHAEKVKLLRNARALVFPVAWDEPFGLVSIEAMACGTPVICSDKGALPEIVTDKTGFVCRTFAEMCRAVEHIHELKRADCLELVQSKFSARIMALKHIDLYKNLLAENTK